ncbi:hypothetical protein SAMN06265373_104189 [Shimia sagamensis]|uniref:Uncharacterized protein n=1 Tax=Shimia sagamensis TaxID=1566352 RepID=A0ABY1NZI0_9RHOB|nr:hypothetical protein SAMN06265373_104189 [Shimia sagamensis]
MSVRRRPRLQSKSSAGIRRLAKGPSLSVAMDTVQEPVEAEAVLTEYRVKLVTKGLLGELLLGLSGGLPSNAYGANPTKSEGHTLRERRRFVL